jgi:hypothetical protein
MASLCVVYCVLSMIETRNGVDMVALMPFSDEDMSAARQSTDQQVAAFEDRVANLRTRVAKAQEVCVVFPSCNRVVCVY